MDATGRPQESEEREDGYGGSHDTGLAFESGTDKRLRRVVTTRLEHGMIALLGPARSYSGRTLATMKSKVFSYVLAFGSFTR